MVVPVYEVLAYLMPSELRILSLLVIVLAMDCHLTIISY